MALGRNAKAHARIHATQGKHAKPANPLAEEHAAPSKPAGVHVEAHVGLLALANPRARRHAEVLAQTHALIHVRALASHVRIRV